MFGISSLPTDKHERPFQGQVMMIYVVWYFVSGCMLSFGATLIWVWQRLRTGDRRPLFAALVIGLLYIGIGAFGLVYRHGDPFMAFFALLGSLLLLSGY